MGTGDVILPDTLLGVVSHGPTVAFTLERGLAWIVGLFAVFGFAIFAVHLRDMLLNAAGALLDWARRKT